jgi:surfeit locus 1 family protein
VPVILDHSVLAGRHFRPTLWPTVAAVAFVVLTIGLGNWQRHRAEEKNALRVQLDQVDQQPAQDLAALGEEATKDRFRRVLVDGTFDRAHQVLIDNKVQDGRAGYDVVAPMRLSANGTYVLVDRGWVAQGAHRADLPQVDAPATRTTLEGRVNFPPQHYLELGHAADAGPVRQNLDIARIAAGSGLTLSSFIVEQTSDSGDGLVRNWTPPDFGADQHRSYMVQWYSFAALAIALWLGLNWRRDEPSR